MVPVLFLSSRPARNWKGNEKGMVANRSASLAARPPTNERARPRVQASSTVLNEEPREKTNVSSHRTSALHVQPAEGEKWHMFSSSRHCRKCARDKCASPHPRTVTTVTMWGRRSRFQADGGTGPIPCVGSEGHSTSKLCGPGCADTAAIVRADKGVTEASCTGSL